MSKTKVGILITSCLVAGFISGTVFGRWQEHDSAVKEGIDMYHNQCLTGGMVLRKEDGTVVACQPLGVIPKEEPILQEPLDKPNKI